MVAVSYPGAETWREYVPATTSTPSGHEQRTALKFGWHDIVPVTGPVRTACTPFAAIAGMVATTTVALTQAAGHPPGHVWPVPHEPRATTDNASAITVCMGGSYSGADSCQVKENDSAVQRARSAVVRLTSWRSPASARPSAARKGDRRLQRHVGRRKYNERINHFRSQARSPVLLRVPR